MKYEIIGWASVDCPDYPVRQSISPCIERMIIDELKKQGYFFGGDMHEQYCPVFNDGTMASYSWRGWGRVMGIARGDFRGGYDYTRYYMDRFISPELRKYPAYGVDTGKIVLPSALKETFSMHLADGPFEAVKSGRKCFELRLFDKKRSRIDAGDEIVFSREGHEDDRVVRSVSQVVFAPDFETLFSAEFRRYRRLPMDPVLYGGDPSEPLEKLAEKMRAYYSEEEEKAYGVIAIELSLPGHSMETYLAFDFREDSDVIWEDELLQEITYEIRRLGHSYLLGYCDEYDVDVNVMIRKTLSVLEGKEEALARIMNAGCDVCLGIVPHISAHSEDPAPLLTPEQDIIEFLAKHKIRIDLDYDIG